MQLAGRFFKTLWILITKPGFLSVEYKKGNRADYTNPLAMYLLVAALFFIVFFTAFRNQKIYFGAIKGRGIVRNGTLHLLKEGLKKAKTREDSVNIEKTIKALEDSAAVDKDKDDDKGTASGMFDLFDTTYKTVTVYDSLQHLLPRDERDGWFTRIGKRRDIVLSKHYRQNGEYVWIDIVNKLIHYYPYMIFILLPLFALFLKLLYLRRKQFFYADHGLFLIHINTLLFLFMFLYLGVLSLKELTTSERLTLTAVAILIFGCIYTLNAVKRFYEQGWAKTTMKFILFSILCSVFLFSAFALFFSISITWS